MKKTTVVIAVVVLAIAVAVGGAVVALRPSPSGEAEQVVAPPVVEAPEAAPAEGPFSTEIGARAESAPDADAPGPGAAEGRPRAEGGERPGPRPEGEASQRQRGEPRPDGARGEGGERGGRDRGQWLRERLTEEQFAQLEKLRADMREAGATREETRAATRELLQSFGVEMPERRRGGGDEQ